MIMNVYVNEITGITDAIVSMHMSRRSWSRCKESDIIETCDLVLDRRGKFVGDSVYTDNNHGYTNKLYNEWIDTLLKWGHKHITMLRYIDISVTVEGLHRGGQDDWDSHAMRFNNRIIRSSTRLSNFEYEMSDYYNGKIIPTDLALQDLGIELPEVITKDGKSYVKTVNGYIREDLKDNKDVKRGLYMLSIPSNFIFKVNLTEFAHVYKERGLHGTAHPEVKELCEQIADQIEEMQPKFTKQLLMNIKN